ncbi:MAG TPA: hypothetical protein VFP47_06680, partial [Pyrinomonadaceae bacterium]|nr:hypothetical protein [Pyrinomonadaceae bacterium]
MSKPIQGAELLGDLPEEEFRIALHQAAEWAADYRSSISERPISAHGQPGDVSAQLPPSIPKL